NLVYHDFSPVAWQNCLNFRRFGLCDLGCRQAHRWFSLGMWEVEHTAVNRIPSSSCPSQVTNSLSPLFCCCSPRWLFLSTAGPVYSSPHPAPSPLRRPAILVSSIGKRSVLPPKTACDCLAG